jgi:DNA-binding response OmpR family regulator
VKPAKMDELLRVVKEHLRRQQEAREYGEEKVKEFVESRVKELESKERDKASGHK